MRDRRLNNILMDAACLRQGGKVLDLGAGGGEPAIAAAKRVGIGGSVIALDHVPEMLEGARGRAAALSLRQVRCVVGDMVELPFDDGAFDAVIARFSLMSVPDQAAALREARRVLRPGGRAAFLVWGPEAKNDRFRTLREGAAAFFGPDAMEPKNRQRLGDEGVMTVLLRQAGFSDIEERGVQDNSEIAANRRVWASGLERNYAGLIAALSAERRTALEEAVRIAFEPFRDGDVYRFRAEARLGAGSAT